MNDFNNIKKNLFNCYYIFYLFFYPFILKISSKYYVSFFKKYVYKITNSHWLVNLGGEPKNVYKITNFFNSKMIVRRHVEGKSFEEVVKILLLEPFFALSPNFFFISFF